MKSICILIHIVLLAVFSFPSHMFAAGGLEGAVDKLTEQHAKPETEPEWKVIQRKEGLIREYTSHLMEYPNDTEVMIKVGVIYLWLTRQGTEYYEKADDMFARALQIDPSLGPDISDVYILHIIDQIDVQKAYWLNNCFNSAIYADPSSKDRILRRIRPFANFGNLTAIAYAFICAAGSEQEAYKQTLMKIEYNRETSVSDYDHLEIAAIHTRDPDICLKAGQIAYHRMNDPFISAEDRRHIEERIKNFLTPDQYQTIVFGSKPKFHKQYEGIGYKGGEFDDGTIRTAEDGVDYTYSDVIIVTGESFDVYENGTYITYQGKYEKPSHANNKGAFLRVRAPKGVVFTVKVIDSEHQSKWDMIQGSEKSFTGKGIGGSENLLNLAQWGLEITNGHKIVVQSSDTKTFYVEEDGKWKRCSGNYERIIDFNPLYGNWFQAYAEEGTTLNFHIERLSSSF